MSRVIVHKDEDCIGKAVAIFGDKWNPLLVKALSTHPKRFCELQDEVRQINPTTLTSKLVLLEEHKIIHKKVFAEVPPRSQYSLTKKGRDLLPILKSMSVWGKKY